MNELIKISKSEGGIDIVSARELYSFLSNNAENVTRWMSANIINNTFAIEGIDYQRIMQVAENGRKIEDFAITIDFAKELSMLSQCEKGKQARLYFIECEKRLKSNVPTLPKTFSEALQLAADQARQLELQAPKVEYHDKVLQATNTFTSTTVAKELGLSAKKLHHILHEKGVIFFQDNHWVLYSKYQAEGYTKTRTTTYETGDGEIKTNVITVWTERGREFIHRKLNSILVPAQY